MSGRKAISAKLRFEVFKRDKFTCQYCGATAAQKLLHCDHVKPVADGGPTTLLNLITACVDCNLGKGRRPLSDESAMAVQHKQLADLEERRQQLELMRQWREELEAHTVSEVDIVADAIAARAEWSPNEKGRNDLRRLIKKHGLVEVLEAASESFDMHFRDGTEDDWNTAFKKIGLVIHMRTQEKDDPHIRKLLYIQGILRKRLNTYDDYVVELRRGLQSGVSVDRLERLAKKANDWPGFVAAVNAAGPQAPAPQPEPGADEPEEHEFDEAEQLMQESWAAWDDPQFHVNLFAQSFTGSAKDYLEALAEWVGDQRGGYIKDPPVDAAIARTIRGLAAVGLVYRAYDNKDVVVPRDDGLFDPAFAVWVLSPREATNAFNRFGSLRLGFWHSPRLFPSVGRVH